MTFVASATASSSRSNDDAMSCASRRRSDKEIDAVSPPPFGLMGVAGNLRGARHRRCPCITSSSLLDLPSQDPSANVMLFLGRDTMSEKPGASSTSRRRDPQSGHRTRSPFLPAISRCCGPETASKYQRSGRAKTRPPKRLRTQEQTKDRAFAPKSHRRRSLKNQDRLRNERIGLKRPQRGKSAEPQDCLERSSHEGGKASEQ